ncbi:MAG: alpha/beta hydrolase [Marinicaulis sp.]|nr:alpha/beta hydrolase [Marinicaulis sp.]NNE40082.1 alpha/beta hydrolase [Marinicaulis sp.]
MPELSVNGVNLYYQDDGNGPPLLLIAGLTSDGASWAPIISKLTEKYRVISPDNRGCGRTLPPPDEVTIDGMADDAAALLEHLKVSKANVFGHSMGGVVSMTLAAKYPDRINRLALMASGPKANARTRSVIDNLLALREAGAPDIEWYREWFHWLFHSSFFENKSAVDASIALAANYARRQSAGNMRAQVEAMRDYDAAEHIAKINAPTLILGGDADLLYPPEEFEAAYADLRDKRFLTIAQTAHSLHWDRPEATVNALNDFFGVI